MFDKDWMEYFQRETPLAYYFILFLQYVISLMTLFLSYFSYIVLLLVLVSPIFMMYFGIKAIKIKLIKDKHQKKIKKERETYQNMYINRLDRNLKKKKNAK